jgi:hypothetical protein
VAGIRGASQTVLRGSIKMKFNVKWLVTSMVAISLTGLPGFAQDPSTPGPAQSGGWKRFQQSAPPSDGPQPFDPSQAPPQAPAPAPAPPPGRITIPAGTWVTVRVNEPLSSDHNKPGDAFSATLVQPLIVNGVVVARRGQLVTGTVSEAKKAGRAAGLSRLGLELTEIGLVDGNQVQVKSKVMDRHGDTSYGRDAFAIGATVGTGAAIGAAVNGGVGAGVGAAAGLVASTIGVLLTRGRPTVVYPETPLTFRLDAPVSFDANSSAFQPASQQDYGQGVAVRRPGPPAGYGYGYGAAAPYGPGPAYGYYPPAYYPYPYYWGPSFFFGFRGGFRRW